MIRYAHVFRLFTAPFIAAALMLFLLPIRCFAVTQEELDKLSIPRETIFVFRDRGTGRPTKKERRELDGLMDGIYYDGDE